MAISGKQKEQKEFRQRKIGLFEASVIAINPSIEEYKEILDIELDEESKATEYLGESKDGNIYLRVAVWLEEIKTKEKYCVSFFLENKERENKDATKKQYINKVGVCSWADDPNNLPDWFKEREYRIAYVGEEELLNFMKFFLGKLDVRDKECVLDLEWQPLMKGNVKEIAQHINGEWTTNVVALATVVTKEKDGEIVEYQNIYNKAFLPPFALKQFRLIDYSSPEVLVKLKAKKTKELKIHEKFVLQVMDPEHGNKDSFMLKDLQEYNAEDFLVSSDKVISPEDASY